MRPVAKPNIDELPSIICSPDKMKPEIQYNLHDSLITAVVVGPRREMTLAIDLYPIYYPGERKMSLRFGGILNFDAVLHFGESMQAGLAEDKDFVWRVDGFDYDTTRPSTTNDLHFFLQVANLEGLRIHCSKMTMNEGEPSVAPLPRAPQPGHSEGEH